MTAPSSDSTRDSEWVFGGGFEWVFGRKGGFVSGCLGEGGGGFEGGCLGGRGCCEWVMGRKGDLGDWV